MGTLRVLLSEMLRVAFSCTQHTRVVLSCLRCVSYISYTRCGTFADLSELDGGARSLVVHGKVQSSSRS